MDGKILIVDDNEDVLFALNLLLEPYVEKIKVTTSPARIEYFMDNFNPDIILLDMNFSRDASSGQEGFLWLEKILQKDPQAVVLFITAYADTEKAVKAIRAGAIDFIPKPWETEKLLATISSAIRLRQTRTEVVALKEQLTALSAPDEGVEIIGESPAILEVIHTIKKISGTDANILLLGENGTGKDLIARAIYQNSPRNGAPFVPIDLGAIPETLFESELFGYEKGAFTDARKDKAGRMETASGGTLFLDEIGELPLFAQPKLLRVLQEYELERVGSNKKVHLDIRIIAATNRSLSEMVAERTFRGDLFYRINVINLKLPPLRSRREDIMPIAASYLEHLRSRIRTPLKKFAPETEELLVSYDWPGNVRELQNMLEYAANLCETDTLTPADLPEILTLKARPCEKTEPGPAAVRNSGEQVLAGLLEKYGYTLEGKKQIAAELGISLRTLYRKLNRLNIQQPDITLPR